MEQLNDNQGHTPEQTQMSEKATAVGFFGAVLILIAILTGLLNF